MGDNLWQRRGDRNEGGVGLAASKLMQLIKTYTTDDVDSERTPMQSNTSLSLSYAWCHSWVGLIIDNNEIAILTLWWHGNTVVCGCALKAIFLKLPSLQTQVAEAAQSLSTFFFLIYFPHQSYIFSCMSVSLFISLPPSLSPLISCRLLLLLPSSFALSLLILVHIFRIQIIWTVFAQLPEYLCERTYIETKTW